MTREEAIRIIKIVLTISADFEIIVQGEEMTEEKCKEAVEIVTKALMQEPCEDAISRRDAVNACWNGWGHDNETIKHIERNILKLPPVTPAEKVAHWEYVQYDGNPNIGNWHCSKCSAIVNYKPTYNWEKKPYYKYCPNCGRKMEEEEDT